MPGVPTAQLEILESFRDKIFKDTSKLSSEGKFRFACHPEISCFGKCCANINIFLTPYDVLRMKNALGISSSEFLEKYTVPLILEENKLPVVVLKMGDDEEKKCPFLSDQGCTIYDDRPWSCRMYPLGLASSKTEGGEGEEFCFVVEEGDELCRGFEEDREQTVEEWFENQDVNIYNRNLRRSCSSLWTRIFKRKSRSTIRNLRCFSKHAMI